MDTKKLKVAAVLVCLLAGVVVAGIPEPDAILYGSVAIDGVPVQASDDVAIIARVDGVPDLVGSYQMGDNTEAGDNYVLRIRLESLADRSAQSSNAAIVGDTVRIFVQQNGGPELEANETFTISQRGEIQMLDLTAVSCSDSDGDGVCDKDDICDGFDDNIDTDSDGVPDGCDICPGANDNDDGDRDGAPDGCDNCPNHSNADQADCDDDGTGDVCAIAEGLSEDCNKNGVPDNCDIADGDSPDVNDNGIPDECECPPDFDLDGDVDAADLAQLLGSWGPCAGCPADFDGDGDVDAADLAQLLGSWGPCV